MFVYSLFRITDNLPCATKFELLDTGETQYEHGYKLGFVKDNKVYVWKENYSKTGKRLTS